MVCYDNSSMLYLLYYMHMMCCFIIYVDAITDTPSISSLQKGVDDKHKK